jgi:endonuclease IV
MDYGQLGKEKIIPKERLFTKVPRFGKLPTLANKIGYWQFGLVMEKIIESFIVDNTPPNDMKEMFDALGAGKSFKPEQFEPTRKLVKRFRNRDDVRFQVEITDAEARIQGHPDLITTKTIYEIKTTAKFSGMRVDTVLQLLSYFCLARRRGMDKLTHIGLILPGQNLILNVSLKNWDWKPFYEKLKEAMVVKEGREKMIRESYRRNARDWEKYFARYVGTHVHKEQLIKYIQHRPQVAYQFFVGGRNNTHANCTEAYKKNLKKTLEKYPQARVFIHSPYTLNLSRKYVSSKEVEMAQEDGKPHPEGRWIYSVTTKLLEMGADLGLKGIVIHCGQKGKFTWKEAVDNMREHVNKIARHGTPNCHHDPMSYIKVLEVRQVPIKLIHFNSSLFEKGCCKDRHANPQDGWISYDQLTAVLKWAVDKDIPLVTE